MQEAHLHEDKSKHEQEVARLQSYFDNKNITDKSGGECDRCCSVYNLSNVIGKNQLDQGLHKEILCFEKTILEINHQEKPLLDKLIEKILDIIKEIHPDSTVVYPSQSFRYMAALRLDCACHGRI